MSSESGSGELEVELLYKHRSISVVRYRKGPPEHPEFYLFAKSPLLDRPTNAEPEEIQIRIRRQCLQIHDELHLKPSINGRECYQSTMRSGQLEKVIRVVPAARKAREGSGGKSKEVKPLLQGELSQLPMPVRRHYGKLVLGIFKEVRRSLDISHHGDRDDATVHTGRAQPIRPWRTYTFHLSESPAPRTPSVIDIPSPPYYRPFGYRRPLRTIRTPIQRLVEPPPILAPGHLPHHHAPFRARQPSSAISHPVINAASLTAQAAQISQTTMPWTGPAGSVSIDSVQMRLARGSDATEPTDVHPAVFPLPTAVHVAPDCPLSPRSTIKAGDPGPGTYQSLDSPPPAPVIRSSLVLAVPSATPSDPPTSQKRGTTPQQPACLTAPAGIVSEDPTEAAEECADLLYDVPLDILDILGLIDKQCEEQAVLNIVDPPAGAVEEPIVSLQQQVLFQAANAPVIASNIPDSSLECQPRLDGAADRGTHLAHQAKQSPTLTVRLPPDLTYAEDRLDNIDPSRHPPSYLNAQSSSSPIYSPLPDRHRVPKRSASALTPLAGIPAPSLPHSGSASEVPQPADHHAVDYLHPVQPGNVSLGTTLPASVVATTLTNTDPGCAAGRVKSASRGKSSSQRTGTPNIKGRECPATYVARVQRCDPDASRRSHSQPRPNPPMPHSMGAASNPSPKLVVPQGEQGRGSTPLSSSTELIAKKRKRPTIIPVWQVPKRVFDPTDEDLRRIRRASRKQREGERRDQSISKGVAGHGEGEDGGNESLYQRKKEKKLLISKLDWGVPPAPEKFLKRSGGNHRVRVARTGDNNRRLAYGRSVDEAIEIVSSDEKGSTSAEGEDDLRLRV